MRIIRISDALTDLLIPVVPGDVDFEVVVCCEHLPTEFTLERVPLMSIPNVLVQVIFSLEPPPTQHTLFIPWEVIGGHMSLIDQTIGEFSIFAQLVGALKVTFTNVMSLLQVDFPFFIIISAIGASWLVTMHPGDFGMN